ncbi:MAG: thioredoxin domain-containing protein, partial [Alphaproteobacteria bacterium]
MTAAAANMLDRETSPYLLQHKDNPVHWMAWSEETLALAKRENKPILLSVGYAACHWCHVMAHESFENPAIADLMNQHYVNIKVDREERPDIDGIYQSALQMIGEHGGWPLTMFLTPDGEPFWGGTYFPPAPRYGRPGFGDLLTGVAKVFHDEPDRIAKNVEALREGLRKLSQPRAGTGISIAVLDQIAEQLAQRIDPFRGGIGGAPKFPQCGILEQLWRAWRRSGKEPFRKAVQVSLDNMCQGGIYDHLGGGFARYSVDERWLAPHFEKMLYDNAALVELLTLAWQDGENPLYARRVAETIGWVMREMRNPGGGFSSSLDADSEGAEGKFYVWSETEVDSLLGERSAPFKATYDVTRHGNWEETNILNRLSRMALLDPATETQLEKDRAVLFAARAKRIPPGLDDKILADWNGLMIAALAIAGDAFERPGWIAAGADAFRFVQTAMTAGGRLRHSWRDGRARHPATLDDYASLCRAALALYEATGDAAYVEQAEAWLATVDAQHGDPDGPGYFFTAADTPTLIARRKDA